MSLVYLFMVYTLVLIILSFRIVCIIIYVTFIFGKSIFIQGKIHCVVSLLHLSQENTLPNMYAADVHILDI